MESVLKVPGGPEPFDQDKEKEAEEDEEEQEEEDEEAFEVLADEQEAKEDARAEAINIANGY